MCVILTLDMGKPTLDEQTNVVINLNGMLIVITSELSSKDSKDATIKVCDALKCKGWIWILTFQETVVPCRTVGSPHMNNVNRSGSTRETFFLVPPHHLPQLLRCARHEHILVRYARDVANKQQIEVAMIWCTNVRRWLQLAERLQRTTKHRKGTKDKKLSLDL